ncbi:MAG: hypothetical protein Q9207_003531 [Kuettlingeria erythrocarpa]
MDPISMSASILTIGAFAVQALNSIQYSHELYTSIKDAPERLGSLLEELKSLSKLLESFHNNALDKTGGWKDGLDTALAYCTKALESIETFSSELNESIPPAKGGRRQWAAFKVTLSEKKLKHYATRLERAKSMLSLALQISRSQQQILWKPPNTITIVPREFAIRPPVSQKPNEHVIPASKTNHEKHQNQQRRLLRQKDSSRYGTFFGTFVLTRTKYISTLEDKGDDLEAQELTFYPHANRYLNRGFSLLSEGSFGAWRYSLRTFGTFTTEDPIYICCVMGDLSGVENLFSKKKASPFDVTRDGFTLLHIAAAFGNVELCRLLLAEGADADAASNSEWTSENQCVFEARTTPLQAAADFSGRWAYDHGHELKTQTLLPYCKDFARINKQDQSTAFLDTFRVLAENGGDPMASNTKGDTALHLHTGATHQFQYLLQQEQFVTDCTQLNYDGDTITERHARWWWSQGPVRARLAFEHENIQRRKFCEDAPSKTPPFPITSRTLLLHETARHLRHFFIKDDRVAFDSALQLVRMLHNEHVDIHDIEDEGPHQYTPLAQIKTIASEIEISPDGLERESHITNAVLDEWLRTLQESDVDLEQYVREEERLIGSSGIGCQWEHYMFDDSWEYCVEWVFGNTADFSSRLIAVRYHFRPASAAEGKTKIFDDDRIGVPGAWIGEPG